MLNVHQVRLRFIFARALYLRRLFQKAYGRGIFKKVGSKYTVHLRCRYAEINARRTKSTPPLYFG